MRGDIPPDRAETAFSDFKHPLDDAAAVVEANRCLYCYDAPCIKACPTSIDIPEFIRKIATENVKGSAKTILSSNILGMSCARVCPVEVLCVGACVYNKTDTPVIQIGKLQRYSTDKAHANGWRFFEAGPSTGKTVALLGGGPASLACAHELRRFGHTPVIYEKRALLGGLNVFGVAPYKLRADDAMSEVDYVMGIGGIEVKLGVEVGKDVSLADIEAKHDAVFVGIGLGADSQLGVPGEALPGVHGAVEWIEKMKLGKVAVPARCVVVGGGNTAVDVVRELLGLGATEVYMVYRGDQDGMSGYHHEWFAARVESARALWRTLPIAYEGDGRVQRVRMVRVDEHKKPIAGSEHAMDCDLVLVATGQGKLGALVGGLAGITLTKGCIDVGPGGKTGRNKWFAGGDAANGGKEVVNAVAEGRDAARAIHASFGGSNG